MNGKKLGMPWLHKEAGLIDSIQEFGKAVSGLEPGDISIHVSRK